MANSNASNKSQTPRSLRRSLLRNLTLTTLLPLIFLAILVLYSLTNRADEEVSRKNQLIARALSGQVEVFLQAPEATLLGLRELYLSHQVSLGPQNFQEILDAQTEEPSLLESIYMLNQQGMVTAVGIPHKHDDLRPEFDGLQLGHLGFIRQARRQKTTVWSDTFLSLISGKTSLALAIPVGKEMLVGNIRIDLIGDFLKDLQQEEHIESTIVDRHGEIIACSHTPPEMFPSNLRNLSLISKPSKADKGTAIYIYQGISYLGSIAQIKGPNWQTLVTQTSTNAYQPVRRTSLFFLGAFFITFAVVLLVAFFTARRISAPISLFAQQARALAEGNYARRHLTAGYSEIALLADNFNHMANRIHERETALRKSEEGYRTLAENLPAIVYRLHLHGKSHLQFMNNQHLHMTGFTSEDFPGDKGCPFAEKVHPDDREQFLETIQNAMGSHAPFALEYRFKHADGDYRIFFEKGCPLYNANAEATHIDGIIFDITERKRAEEIIVQSEKMLTMGGLAAGMAHEINNPLAGILQNCQLIEQRLNDSHEKNLEVAQHNGIDLKKLQGYLSQRHIPRMLDAIRKSGNRAAGIVENILDFSRKSHQDFTQQSVPDLIDKSLELAKSDYDLQNNFDFRNIEIVRQYQENLPQITCEPSQIQQVFLNLFKNGAQAMHEHRSAHPSFKVSSYVLQQRVVIEISDSGPGISEQIQKRIFEPFFTTKEVGKGTGLGLSICYFIISEKHQGSMTVKSVPGGGTTFTIALPCSPAGEKNTHPKPAPPDSNTISRIE